MFQQKSVSISVEKQCSIIPFYFFPLLGVEWEAKKYQYWRGYKQSFIIKPFLKETCVTFTGE